jgi:hypothetical protein
MSLAEETIEAIFIAVDLLAMTGGIVADPDPRAP